MHYYYYNLLLFIYFLISRSPIISSQSFFLLSGLLCVQMLVSWSPPPLLLLSPTLSLLPFSLFLYLDFSLFLYLDFSLLCVSTCRPLVIDIRLLTLLLASLVLPLRIALVLFLIPTMLFVFLSVVSLDLPFRSTSMSVYFRLTLFHIEVWFGCLGFKTCYGLLVKLWNCLDFRWWYFDSEHGMALVWIFWFEGKTRQ